MTNNIDRNQQNPKNNQPMRDDKRDKKPGSPTDKERSRDADWKNQERQ